MLFPTDAYELVHADPRLAGSSPNSIAQPQQAGAQLAPVKHYYGAQLPESEWAKTAPPFIVWVPGRDAFDANTPKGVREIRGGRLIEIDSTERVQAGHTVHLFVARTKDLACYRAMYALLCRFRMAMRYALNTTANYRTDGGGFGGDSDLARYPALLHYSLGIAPYVPVCDVPDLLAEVESVSIVSSRGIDPGGG